MLDLVGTQNCCFSRAKAQFIIIMSSRLLKGKGKMLETYNFSHLIEIGSAVV